MSTKKLPTWRALVGLGVATLILGALTFLVHGKPVLEPACEVRTLKPNHVCLSQLTPQQPLLWVDARARDLWQKNGVNGSLLWNLQEDQGAFEETVMEALLHAPTVVVYCDTELCGTSEQIAEKIRNLGVAERVWVLQGGYEALRANPAFREKLRAQ